MYKTSRLLLILSLILSPAFILADNLKELLSYALNNNNIVISKSLVQKAMAKNVQATKNSYFPTLNLGASYTRFDNRSPYRPGDVYSSKIAIKFNMYDGGRRINIIKQQLRQAKSLKFTTLAYKENLQLLIIKEYFKIKNLQASLYALKQKSVDLSVELKREKRFYSVGIATYSNIDSIKATYSNNKYQINVLIYKIQTAKQSLFLDVGKKINKLQNSVILPPKNITVATNNEIRSLNNSVLAKSYQANSLMSVYKPKITITDTYTLNKYGRTDAYHPAGQTNQNILLVNFDMILFDDGVVKTQKEALLLQQFALKYQIKQAKKIQNINVKLAILNIKMAKIQILSLMDALKSAKSAYKIVKRKYDVGNLDYIAYLNALDTKINTYARYKEALNNLQVSYAKYYYYTNQNIRKYLR